MLYVYQPPQQEAPAYTYVTSSHSPCNFYCCYFHVVCLTSYLLYSYVCVSAQKCLTHSHNKGISHLGMHGETGWMRVLLWKWVWSPSRVLQSHVQCNYCCPVHKRSFWPASNESHEARVRLYVHMQKVNLVKDMVSW